MAHQSYFLCGVGGSGMASLARLLLAGGHAVAGSDRARDQGRTPDKFARLARLGVTLHPQDGSGVTGGGQVVVASAAVEDAVPDIAAAKRLSATILTRAELLAALFNAAPASVAIGGTSGKSTTTAMIATILKTAGRRPSVMNGAVMKNFVSAEDPDASAAAGDGALFVSEVDESDGSIARFQPTVSVLNNVSLDHKSMDELRALFGDFVAKAAAAVINSDDPEAAALAARVAPERLTRFSLEDASADVYAEAIELGPDFARFALCERGAERSIPVRLATPGRHNIANALAAAAAARALGVSREAVAEGLIAFAGVRRRFDIVGRAGGVTVIDDFAHNPDKIAATLATLKAFPGRLLIMWQPHGFGPLRLMRAELAESFAEGLGPEDRLTIPEPVYFGGTVERSVTSADLAADIAARGRRAEALATREACGEALLAEAKAGDRLVVMGARDDTLSEFAASLLERLT